MNKKIVKSLLLFLLPFSLIGCNKKKEEPIVDKQESTVIKDATSVDEYLKKKDYKSIAYAFIYHIKESIQSYESETNGNVKAKVAFINYDIKYNSITYKSGNTFYSKDDSKSTLMTIKNEFYMVDKEKILVSKDLKKYNVYTMEDYHKISYTPNQYTVMGYVFTDESITKTELISDKDDNVSIKYTLDNELATHLVKVDLKNSGGLSSYPTFHNIEITLSMKRDFTPISYSIDSIYDASKAVIGTARTTQHGECLFRKVNEKITVPNETFLAEQLGAKLSEIIINDQEQGVKDELMTALKNLDFEHGVNVSGDLKLSLDLLGDLPLVLSIDSNILFDTNRLTDDKIYQIFDFYAKLEGDEQFNTLISLVKTFAGDQLGEYADLLADFKSVEIVYDEAGSLFLVPVNEDNVITTILKVKLTDILDVVLQQVNLYNLVNGSNQDFATFTKIEGKDENNYEVEITLNDDINKQIEDGLNLILENPDYALLKTMLGYQRFDAIKAKVGVKDGMVNTLDASLTYIKGSDDGGEASYIKTLLSLHLDAINQEYDFESKIEMAQELYSVYLSVQELKARMEELDKNVYVSQGYLDNVNQALEEYSALSDQQKDFVGRHLEERLLADRRDVNNILIFLKVFYRYDLTNLNNEAVLALSKAFNENPLNQTLLRKEISEQELNILNNLSDAVDYSALDNALDRIIASDNEFTWGLSNQEIKDIKLLVDIATYNSSAYNSIWVKFMLKGQFTFDFDVFASKINNLYNNLPNS